MAHPARPRVIHGDENNALKELCDSSVSVPHARLADRYHFGGENGVGLVDAQTADEDDPDVAETHALFADLRAGDEDEELPR